MGSDRSSDLNPNPLNDIEDRIRDVAQTVAQTSTIYGGYQKTSIRPSVDDLEAIVDTKKQAADEAAWDDPKELTIQALIHRAWALELERQGWLAYEINSDHIKALRMAKAAIRLIPKREPIA